MTATGRSEPSVMLPALRIVLHAGALCEAACYSDNASPLVCFCRFDGSREQCLRARGWPGNRVAEEDARPRPKMLPPQSDRYPGRTATVICHEGSAFQGCYRRRDDLVH
jgi:hypothetical protein